ncbi:EscV/YscV/HrcV family type III secretion system export apparatus protein [Cupriavidus sp. AU9028]|uniref:EscV/YscV/HrcV family type III secretion system export apparatus protein n=1 Tax=Cupriavidus sp. AU9028 TaxID=2871157 RepID=UPI001C94A1E7|nr:EscV/YscV/HrcV family type III secretion system export apparatus protein [Cupriavidus sp. AU9028]MBY4897877.1 EscV/YscV/HrcV family type III secretion system export apparatus protein [Cupriavidus sp. AU9028]
MKRLATWLNGVGGRQDVVLAIILMVAVFMMILPLPTILVDLLIAINLALSLLLLMTAIYVRDPLDLSALPSLLLITTLFRLALTVSTSRLILLQHDAGEIVTAFGNFVVGGNLAVGIIVFSIITVVQFIVITKGAERVAEVGARFSLDAMPGKQMSIDGDLRSGTIDANEAKRQRQLVQKESQLYGAMDGSMKFVKGDAIAGIIVILVNIIGGIAVGTMQHDMGVGKALEVYSVLSIGDGLIAQIPALIISIAAGIVVTRVPGEKRENLAQDLANQFSRQPNALLIASGVMVLFALVPGFPAVIFLPLGLMVGLVGLQAKRRAKAGTAATGSEEAGQEEAAQMAPGAEPLVLRVSGDMAALPDLHSALESLRWDIFERLGIPLQPIPVRKDGALPAGTVNVMLYSEPVLRATMPENHLLLPRQGPRMPLAAQVETLPFGGLTLQWIPAQHELPLAQTGLRLLRDGAAVAYMTRVAVDRFADEFVGVQETRFLMDAMEARYGELVKELQRQLPISKISEVLQRLVAEGISIRDLRTIFEALIEWSPKEKETVMLTEYVRVSLRRQIVGRHASGGAQADVWLVGDGIENMIRDSVRQTAAGAYSTLQADQIERIVSRIKAAIAGREDIDGAIVTAIDVRRFLRKFLERELFRLPVLSFQELGDDVQLHVLGNIDLIGEYDDAYA